MALEVLMSTGRDQPSAQPTGTDMIAYYQRRAPHYDDVYARPERQPDLRQLHTMVPARFTGRDVIEVAAGTGYWTQRIADTAKTVTATDYNAAPLAEAARRDHPRGNVEFRQADAFRLDEMPDDYSAAFAGFWWSHLRLDAVDTFLEGLVSRLRPGSPITFVDNRYAEGSSTPIAREDPDGNTYQHRRLPDGTVHEVLKNFPQPDQLMRTMTRHGVDAEVVQLDYFWVANFSTR
jgi:demethylmenaquinone methyltransferase/2-methoxy-6-polyprenyl-1,4-benzoquinol methylase